MFASTHILLTGNDVNVHLMLSFGPAAELVAWRVPKGATFVVEQKDPTTVALFETHHATVTPRPGTSEWTYANHRRAGQLAALKQGPPSDVSVRPGRRAAGCGQWEG